LYKLYFCKIDFISVADVTHRRLLSVGRKRLVKADQAGLGLFERLDRPLLSKNVTTDVTASSRRMPDRRAVLSSDNRCAR